MNKPATLQQVGRTFVRYRGRTLSYFSGCDYFRLSSHPAVKKAIGLGLREFGLTVAASRLTTGDHALYRRLESDLARFFGRPAAVLLPDGYVTNLVVAQTLAGRFSHALVDERAHVSLADAAQILDCPVLKFKHGDLRDFARTLRRCGRGARPIVLTDGLFAHDGSVAPLKAYLGLLPPDGWLLVDDAHGAGAIGRTGKGAMELEGVGGDRIVLCITLGKAFGVYGGAVLCSTKFRKEIRARSRMFAGSTPLPLPLASAARVALKILKAGTSHRRRLTRNADYVKNALRNAGFELPQSPAPIIPLIPSNSREATRLSKHLLAMGIFPPLIRYPGGPPGGYFRFVISSEHRRKQLDGLIRALREWAGVQTRRA